MATYVIALDDAFALNRINNDPNATKRFSDYLVDEGVVFTAGGGVALLRRYTDGSDVTTEGPHASVDATADPTAVVLDYNWSYFVDGGIAEVPEDLIEDVQTVATDIPGASLAEVAQAVVSLAIYVGMPITIPEFEE